MIPCRSVDSILSDYTRVAMDYLPYCFFMTTKTLVFASSHVSDKPMQTIKLNARNGSKMYKLVSIKRDTVSIRDKLQLRFRQVLKQVQFRFNVQILESSFVNVYCGLNLYKFGVPLWDVLGNWRQGSLPQFRVSQAAGLASGIVNTPPPFYMMKHGPMVPTPKGKAHICSIKIRNSSVMTF